MLISIKTLTKRERTWYYSSMNTFTEHAGARLISASLLAADVSRLGEEIALTEAAGADMIHFDVMDGVFVPRFTFGDHVLAGLRGAAAIPFDVHLMVKEPERLLRRFAEAGASAVTIHAESVYTGSLAVALQSIRALGVKAGLSLKPATDLRAAVPFLELLDILLIMTVEPGAGGQAFMTEMLEKIKALSDIRRQKNLNFLISVDGGIDEKTAVSAAAAGANILVAGSSVFRAKDRARAIANLRAF